MNKRIFLFGIGVGIIIGAALLQLMLIGEKQADKLDNLNGTDGSVRTYTKAELDQAVADERKRLEAETKQTEQSGQADRTTSEDGPVEAGAGTKATETGTKETGKGGDSPADKPTNTASSKPQTDEAKSARVIVRIPPNASVADTADLLAEQGVIPDKKAFIDLMRKKTIRAGYFAFQGQLSLHQVGTIITSQPLDPGAAKEEMAANGH